MSLTEPRLESELFQPEILGRRVRVVGLPSPATIVPVEELWPSHRVIRKTAARWTSSQGQAEMGGAAVGDTFDIARRGRCFIC